MGLPETKIAPDLLITGGILVTMNCQEEIIPSGWLAIRDDKIMALGPGTPDHDIASRANRVIDAQGRVVLPGFINTHTHLFQGLLKGLGQDKNLLDWLDCSVRRALPYIDAEMLYWSALLGCLEALRCGTTTILDYQYVHTREGLDAAVLQAFRDSGIRGILGRGYTDVSGIPGAAACPKIENWEMFFQAVENLLARGVDKENLFLAPGIIWDFKNTSEIKALRDLANSYGLFLTMHLKETEDDDRYAMEVYGKNTIPLLAETGLLGPDFLAVHCVKVSQEEIRILREFKVKVSYNPVSNMILGSGIPPIRDMVETGLDISLATDGAASNGCQNMLEVIKTGILLQKAAYGDPEALSACKAIRMATLGGAVCLGQGEELGSLEIGKKADIVIFNPDTVFCTPLNEVLAGIAYSSTPSNVETVIVGGKVVLEKGVFTNLDEEKTVIQVKEQARRLRALCGL
ncbi:amidohydrolase [Moorellaceae bacterium AZ2]